MVSHGKRKPRTCSVQSALQRGVTTGILQIQRRSLGGTDPSQECKDDAFIVYLIRSLNLQIVREKLYNRDKK